MGSEDDGGFLFFLGLLGDAFGAVAVQGGVSATQEGKVRFVYQVKQPVARFVEETVFVVSLAEFVRCLACCGVHEVTGQGFVVRQVLSGEHFFRADFVAQRTIGETAAQPVFQVFVFGVRHALDDTADTLGGDFVGIVFTFHQDEFAVAAIFLVQSENGMGGRAGAGEGVEDDGVFISRKTNDPSQQSHRLACCKVWKVFRKNLKECFLCILGMTNLLVCPDCFWHQALFYFGEKSFDGWNLVLIFTPPDSVVCVHCQEFVLRNDPKTARWWTLNDTPAVARNSIHSLAVGIAR